jgi:hypothetical protein
MICKSRSIGTDFGAATEEGAKEKRGKRNANSSARRLPQGSRARK